MPYCVNCQIQYADGLTHCPDCGAELAADATVRHGWSVPENPRLVESSKPVELCELDDLVELELIETQLRNAGIASVRRPKRVALFVPAASQERAKQVLSGQEPGAPHEEEETLSLSELHRIHLVCSECDEELTVDLLKERVPATCPKCGHFFDLGPALPVLDRYADVMRMMANADFEIELEQPKSEAEG